MRIPRVFTAPTFSTGPRPPRVSLGPLRPIGAVGFVGFVGLAGFVGIVSPNRQPSALEFSIYRFRVGRQEMPTAALAFLGILGFLVLLRFLRLMGVDDSFGS